MILGQIVSATLHSCISILNHSNTFFISCLPVPLQVPSRGKAPEQTLFVAGLNEGKFFGQARFLKLLVGQVGRRGCWISNLARIVRKKPWSWWNVWRSTVPSKAGQSLVKKKWCGVETGEPWKSKPGWMMSWLLRGCTIFSGGEAEYGNDRNRYWQNRRFLWDRPILCMMYTHILKLNYHPCSNM